MARRAEGEFRVTSWQEETVHQLEGKAKITQARMGFGVTGDMTGDLMSDTLMYYREDGTATYLGLQRFSGSIGGRPGTCVMQAYGSYDGGNANSMWRVVAGSGTGELAGLTGSGPAIAAAGQPGGTYTLEYEAGGSELG